MTNENMKLVYARTPGSFRDAVSFAIFMYLVAALLVFLSFKLTAMIPLGIGTVALIVSGTCSYLAYKRDKDRNYRCPNCNGLLRHRHVAWTDDKMSKIDGMDDFCYRCKQSVSPMQLPSGIYSAIQKDRRSLPFSKTKELLRASQLEEPICVAQHRWLAYEMPSGDKIYYDTQEHAYDYEDVNKKTTRVHKLGELVKILG